MIRIYISPSCSSCRKVRKWFMDEGIPFIEKNIFGVKLSEKELREILTKSENGTDDIISKRSKIIQSSGIDIDSMTINELIVFIQNNPSILKRPIIVDDKKIQVGYDPEEISVFIPKAKRLAEIACSIANCPKFSTCEHATDKKTQSL